MPTISKHALVGPSTRAVLPPSKADPVCFSKPGVVDLCVYRGDSGRVRVRVTDTLGQPVDVSTATWDCDFRSTEDDTVVLCSPDIEPVPGDTNAVDIVLTAECSASLDDDCVWDLEMTLHGEVTTILAGKVLVTKDVSRLSMSPSRRSGAARPRSRSSAAPPVPPVRLDPRDRPVPASLSSAPAPGRRSRRSPTPRSTTPG